VRINDTVNNSVVRSSVDVVRRTFWWQNLRRSVTETRVSKWGTRKNRLTAGLSPAPHERVWRGIGALPSLRKKWSWDWRRKIFPLSWGARSWDFLYCPITPPSLFYANLDKLRDLYLQKVGKYVPPDSTVTLVLPVSPAAVLLHFPGYRRRWREKYRRQYRSCGLSRLKSTCQSLNSKITTFTYLFLLFPFLTTSLFSHTLE